MNNIDNLDDKIEFSWREGIALSDAWFEFADDYAKKKYRDIKIKKAIDPNGLSMLVDLFAKLSSGDLIAIGFCIKPSASGKPIKIPPHVFEQCPKIENLDSNSISASGFEYNRIAVLNVSTFRALAEPVPMTDFEKEKNPKNQTQTSNKPKNKIGRPPIKGYILEIIKLLNEQGKLDLFQNKKAIAETIFLKGQSQYPNIFAIVGQRQKPGRSTIEKELNLFLKSNKPQNP